MAETGFEKTEAPTPRRRQEARQQGNVTRSVDLNAACILLASVLLLYVFGLRVLSGMRATLAASLSGTGWGNPTRPDGVFALQAHAGRIMLEALLPLALGLTAVTLLVAVSQVGLIFTLKPLEPSWSKLSPLKGLQRLFDARAGMRLVMSLGKIALVAAVAVAVIYQDLPRIITLVELESLPMFSLACQLVFELALKLAAVLLVLALLDYVFQRWKHEQDLRMTKQEVKEELKQMDGDPMMKQRRMRVARQLILQRLGQDVPKADVVVTNPTHFAVALRYDSATMKAPKVIAKGADFMAMRIRQIAVASGVPILERKELARALYKTVEIGQEVPPQFYTVVAEILAYVYRINGRRSA